MHKKIKENPLVFAMFGLAFVLGVLSPNFVQGSSQTSLLEYGAEGMTLEDDVIRFHLQINEDVNEFLEKLTEEEEPNVVYEATDEECGDDNVSTYCLASKLNDQLTAFEIGMLNHKERFREVEESSDVITLKDAIKQQEIRGTLVESEVIAAEKAVNLTLAVYNETQLTFPIHKELVRLVSNIEDYRDNLAKVRDTIELYPGEFNDVSTIQCK